MKNENFIHIKFEHYEALKAKKDILSSAINLIKITKSIKNYHAFRSEELRIKLKLHRKLKEVVTNIRSLEKILPKVKIPEILKKEEEKIKKEKPIKKIKEKKYKDNLELELQEIQEKLNSLA